MLDIVKDFASVKRWEYTPFCPICGRWFSSADEMVILECSHFFCKRCFPSIHSLTLGVVCPFDGQKSNSTCSGDRVFHAIDYLNTWFIGIEHADESHREALIGQLLKEILNVRRELNFTNVPCRVQITGEDCPQQFKCPCDHTLSLYKTQLCPVKDCQNLVCLFKHEGEVSLPVRLQSIEIGENPRENEVGKQVDSQGLIDRGADNPPLIPIDQEKVKTESNGGKPKGKSIEDKTDKVCCGLF